VCSFSGAFSSSTFEQDSYNRIVWGEVALPQVPTPIISYNSSANEIVLTWSYPVTVDHSAIYRSSTTDGTFTQVGTSTTTSWSEAVPGDSYFYYVLTVQ
jgi:hypothetical protein